MVSSMTQLWMSLGARARARAREREREKSDGSKIALKQKEKKTESDRETNSEGRTPLEPVGVSMVSSRTRLVTRPSACASARARDRDGRNERRERKSQI